MKWNRINTAAAALIVTLCIAIGAGTALAQSTTDGAIGGLVKDQSGAVIPGAKIVVRNIETGATAQAESDATGRYRIISLQPGKYSVEISINNFAPYKATGVIVEVGRISEVDSQLAVSGKSETVEVTEEAPMVNTQQQDFSTNLNQTSINELPINGRRWSEFALLTPGANPDGNFGLISFRGISGLLNNNTIDGGDNNQAFFSEERGRTRLNYSISQAAIQEFQVNTSNYSAEYGRSAGGVVNAITKSGTNSIHGSGFWYIRDNTLGATNPFTKINGQPVKPEDQRQQWGGNIGGPIVKDKLFFFFNYDQQHRNFPGLALPASETFFDPLSASELSTLAGRGVTSAQADSAMTFLESLTGEVPRKGDEITFLPKIDWKLNGNNTVTLTYNRLRWHSPAGIQTGLPVTRGIHSFGNDDVKLDSVNAKLNSLITSRISNELRFQYGRDFEFEEAQPPAPGEATTGPGGFSPQVAIFGGGITFGKPNFLDRRAFPDERRTQVADSVALAYGRHLVKIGFDVNHVDDLLDNLFQEGGVYNYNNRVDFISDYINPAGKKYSSFAQGFGPSAFEFNTNDYNFFLQDDIRVLPRLTINLGARFEYEQLPQPQIANPALDATSKFPSDQNNFAPRIGFAWDIFGDGKTAVRGGYGVYYGRLINSTISNAITNTGMPQGQQQFTLRGSTAGSPLYPNVLSAAPTSGGAKPDVVIFAPGFQMPLIQQFDFSVEREIATNTVFSAAYIGSRGSYLPDFLDTNLPSAQAPRTFTVSGGALDGQSFTTHVYTGARPNPSFGRITNVSSRVNSSYDAMVLQLNRRMRNGLQLQSSYTLAYSDDNGQGSTTFTTGNGALDPNNLGLEESRSSFDIRHRFVASIVWQPNYFQNSAPVVKALLSNYTLAPIISMASGRPYTGTISGNITGGTSTGILGAGGDNRPFFIDRNSFSMPKTATVDMRISRRFAVGEIGKLEFLVEAFNLLNRVNYTGVNSRLYTLKGSTLTFDDTFGTFNNSANTLSRERQIQWAIRFNF